MTIKANKKLTFIREGGDVVIEAGETFTPDSTMNIDQMLKSGKVSEVDSAGNPLKKRKKGRK